MKLLHELPNDVLAHIFTSPHSSFLVIALWKCGDAKLNYKLAHSIDFMDLKDTRLASTSRYPKMLSSLKNLRYLSIDRFNSPLMDTATNLLRELIQIPSSKLATLRLLCEEISAFFDDNSLLASSPPSEAEPLSHINPSPPSSDDPFEAVFGHTHVARPTLLTCDLSKQFPALTTLHLQIHPLSWRGALLPVLSSPASKMPLLPPNLTLLATPSFQMTPAKDAVFANLPESLTSWEVCLFGNPVSNVLNASSSEATSTLHAIFRNPPPSITNISYILFDFPGSLQDLDFLPKSLINFERSWPASGFQPSYLDSLPPLLASIRIDNLPFPGHLLKLPSQLTRLSLDVSGTYDAAFIDNLPRTLTYLAIFDACPTDDLLVTKAGKNANWPPVLSTLELSGWSFNSAQIKLLPSSLTHIYCNWNDTILYIPPGLASLKFNVISPSIGFSLPEDPISLAKISLKGNDMMLSENFVHNIPASITSLSIHLLDAAPIKCLTNYFTQSYCLNSLSIPSWSMSNLHLIPRTITHLKVRETQDLDTLDVSQDSDCFNGLPSGLIKLDMTCNTLGTKRFSRFSCSTLKSLTKLNLYGIGEFSARMLMHLPSELRSIEIRLYNFDAVCADCINPYWTHMEISFTTEEEERLLKTRWPPQLKRHVYGQTAWNNPWVLAAVKRSRQYPDPRTIIRK